MKIRLNKFLAQAGVASRREVDKMKARKGAIDQTSLWVIVIIILIVIFLYQSGMLRLAN